MDLNKIWDYITSKIVTKDDLNQATEKINGRIDMVETRLIRVEVEVRGISERLSLKERIDDHEAKLKEIMEKLDR